MFILAAIGLESLVHSLRTQMKPIPGRIAAAGVTALLLLWSGVQNYDLVMRQYDRQFMAFAWNTSEIGRVIRGFAESQGNPDSAYVVPYPHWVDTRLVGINAGYPLKDYALWPENFAATLEEPGAKLFILYPKDQDSLAQLQQLYPQGSLQVMTRYGMEGFLYIRPPRRVTVVSRLEAFFMISTRTHPPVDTETISPAAVGLDLEVLLIGVLWLALISA